MSSAADPVTLTPAVSSIVNCGEGGRGARVVVRGDRCARFAMDWGAGGTTPSRVWFPWLFPGEVDADEFAVVADEHLAMGEGRVGPDHAATGISVDRVNQMGAADLVVAFG